MQSSSRLLATNYSATDAVLLLLRLALAVVMFAHGAQKMLGWFGGAGFSGTMAFMTSSHIPAFLALIVMIVEFFGSIMLVLGLLTRLWALGIAIDMLVAVMMVHLPNGFFMNWTGQQHGEGFEFHIFPIVIGIALLIAGSGRFSLDDALAAKRRV
ncbi:MAG: DoxX family protein [Candidatus Eremiobacteraeota bacterium]|nr:DoxX family protein [Candidatus Eremiobacteraeota bacterium]MBC5826161.1 DoxX family protein [Candidatus Eremiobacteraeota bacterium]